MKWFTLFLIILLSGSIKAQDELCLSKDELALGNLINKLRAQNNLDVVPWSASLTYVADVHAKDLYLNHDPVGKCNLYSWSEMGRWKACCPDKEDLSCMHDKPFELTDYKSKGYELVFYSNTQVTSGLAFEAWKQTEAANDLILQRGKYKESQWNAMGIAIFDGYVCVWFGQLIDEAGEPLTCDDSKTTPAKVEHLGDKSKIEKQPGYYVVVASRKSKKDAEREVENRKDSRFSYHIVKEKENYRVVSGPYKGYSQALIVKEKLTEGRNKPWIWKADEE